jgi:hypothetical protein
METPANTQNPLDTATDVEPTELDMLKARATMMGVEFSNNIGLDKLRERVNAAMEGTPLKDEKEDDAPVINPLELLATKVAPTEEAAPVDPDAGLSTRQILQRDQMKLVRVRITNLDPKKKDLHGEVITVANEYLGTVRKYIPFGEVTDEGYHIPFCLYTMLSERMFLHIRTFKDKRTGQITLEQKEVREFALEILPPLTEKELATLALAQQAAGGLS